MKTNYANHILLCLSLLFLAACTAPIRNIPDSYHLRDNAGVALISLTVSGECGYVYFTTIKNIDTHQEYTVGMQDIGKEMDWHKSNDTCPSTPDNYFGKLVAIELPAGYYQIYQFEGLGTYRRFSSRHELKMQFTVQPGVVNYLGNLHFHVNKKGFLYSLKNMSKRDIPLFLKKYHQFKLKNIIASPIHMKARRIIPT